MQQIVMESPVENTLNYVKNLVVQANSQVDSVAFMRRIEDASAHKLFTKLNTIIQGVRKLSNEQKTQMSKQILKMQTAMDQCSSKAKIIKIRINKYLDDWSKKTFSSILELQHSATHLNLTGMCGGGDRMTAFMGKYEKFLNHAYFWEHIFELESEYPKLQEQEFRDFLSFQFPKVEKQAQKEKIVEKIVIKEVPVDRVVEKIVEKEIIKEVFHEDKSHLMELQNRISKLQEEINLRRELNDAHCQLYGINMNKQITLGIQLYNKIQHPDAYNALGQLYLEGNLVPQDLKQASVYFKKGIKLQNVVSIYLQGRLKFIYQQKLEKGFNLLKSAADLECIDACIDVGMIYHQGTREIKQNKDLALKYLIKGQETGKGCNDLGLVLIQSNEQQAIQFFQKAIQLGYIPAMYNLGQFYEQKNNFEEAIVYYLMGAQLKDIKCTEALLPHLYQEAQENNTLDKFDSYLKHILTIMPSGEAHYYLGLLSKEEKVQQRHFFKGAELENQKCKEKCHTSLIINVCLNTLCQVRLSPVASLSILVSCQNYHEENDKRRNPKLYKPIYICDSNNDTNEFCNNIIEYLYHPQIFGTLNCIFQNAEGKCTTNNCPYKHEEKTLKNPYQYKFMPKLEYMIEQKSKDLLKESNDQLSIQLQQYIFNKELPFIEDVTHEFKHFKELRVDLILNYICAFLNTNGGTLYIGINDSGIVQGIKLKRKQIDDFQLDLDNSLRHFDPCVLPQQVQIRYFQILNETYVIEIEVKIIDKSQLYFTHQNEAYVKRIASINMLKPKEIKDFVLFKQKA